jgi:uncharacterized HAD superfamily protein
MTKPKSKPIIAVDVDDVLSAQNEAIRLFGNKKYGHSHTKEDFLVEGEYWTYWERIWGVDPEEGQRRLDDFHAAEGTMNQELMPDAEYVLRMLKKDYELVIVTGRKSHFTEITHRWLNKHLPDIFIDVKFVDIWHPSEKLTKAEVCKEIGAGYLIDDNVEHCTLAAQEGVTDCCLVIMAGIGVQN